ncbi:hypothetical protein RQP46_009431 [Phenoliferia psychrophenolica]
MGKRKVAAATSSKRGREEDDAPPPAADPSASDEASAASPASKRRKTLSVAPPPASQSDDDDGEGTSSSATLDVDATVAAALLPNAPRPPPAAAEEAMETDTEVEGDAKGEVAEPEDTPSSLSGLSPEERRAAKGKGKATDPPPAALKKHSAPMSASGATATQKELDFKDDLINQQAALLASLRSSMACNVCLETLDNPFSLACGHVFCRKCLVTWFHRPDPSAPHDLVGSPANSQGSDGSDDDEDDIILGSPSSSRASSIASDPIRAASSDVIVCSDNESSDADSDSDSEEDDKPARAVLRGSLGGRNFSVQAAADDESGDRAWAAMQDRFAAVAAGHGVGAGPSRSGASTITSTTRAAIEGPTNDAMRAARLLRFTRDSAPAPTGAHRDKNLVCPQCRAAVTAPPFRVFALSDMVALVRQAEASGVLAGTGSSEPTGDATADRDLPGMNEADATWGGLFRAPGPETKKEKRARQAQVVHDRDDGVRRCFDCNWELDAEGVCEGCNRHWDISDDGMSDAEAQGFLLDFGGGGGGHQLDGDHSDLSSDDSEDSQDDGFIDNGHYPAAPPSASGSSSSARSRQLYVQPSSSAACSWPTQESQFPSTSRIRTSNPSYRRRPIR